MLLPPCCVKDCELLGETLREVVTEPTSVLVALAVTEGVTEPCSQELVAQAEALEVTLALAVPTEVSVCVELCV